jgi:hypothetical protein
MRIELLTVPDCSNTEAALDLIATAMAGTGVTATVTITIIASDEQAQHRRFVGSPTILLDGSDPFARGDEHIALACRLYPTPEGPRGIPTIGNLGEALRRAAADRTTGRAAD